MEIELKEKYDLLFKYIVIGDTSVGKSCVLHQYLRNKCNFSLIIFTNMIIVNQNSKHTVGVEFGMKFLKIGGKVIKIQIWDTAG